MDLPTLPYFTLLAPVEAEVFPCQEEPYFTWLLPGPYFSVLELTADTIAAFPLTDDEEAYFICVDEPAHWSRFAFSDDPDTRSMHLPFPN